MRFVACILAAVMVSAALSAADETPAATLRRRMVAAEAERFDRTVALARMLARTGRIEEARTLFTEALALRDDDADVRAELLDVLARLGDQAAQLPLLVHMAEARPAQTEPHLELAACLWRLGRADDARRAWRDVLARFPTSRQVCDDVIGFQIAEHLFDDARSTLKLRRERFGEDADGLYSEARMAVAEGKPGDAVPLLLRCLDYDGAPDAVESLLWMAARDAGRTAEVSADLRKRFDETTSRLASRLLQLARDAAATRSYADAVSFGDRALPLLTDPVTRAQLTAEVAAWRALAPP